MNAQLNRVVIWADAKPTGSGFQGKCPLCEKNKLNINAGDKQPVIAHCFHCGTDGQQELMKRVLAVANSGATPEEVYHPPLRKPGKDAELLSATVTAAEQALDSDADAKKFLANRGISIETAKKFRLGVAEHYPQGKCIIIPYFEDVFGTVLSLKYRQLIVPRKADHTEDKSGKWRHDKAVLGTYRLFNLPLLQGRDADNPLIIVESELDAMMLSSMGFDAVSVDSSEHKLTEEDRTALLASQPIFIAPDQDKAGFEMCERFMRALPGSRLIGGYGETAKDLGDLREVLKRQQSARYPQGKDLKDWLEKLIEEAASQDAEPLTNTDAGNGQRFVNFAAAKVRFCKQITKDGWLAWNGQRWKPDAIGIAMKYGRDTAKLMLDGSEKHYRALQREIVDKQLKQQRDSVLAGVDSKESLTPQEKLALKKAEADYSFALHSLNDSKLLDMLSQASKGTVLCVEAPTFDSNADLLNCQNGTYDLESHAFYPARQEDLLTQIAKVTYDPSALCPKWMDFLKGVTQGDEKLQEHLKRVFGYLLTGSMKEQLFFMIFGPGGTGKSTYWRTIQGMLGDYCTTASPGLFIRKSRNAKPNGNNATPGIAALKGRRVVVTTEVSEGEKFDEALLKLITGGDVMSARPLYGAPFDFQPQCKPVFLVNHLPGTDDFSGAFSRRMRIVKFEHVFSGTADEVKDYKEQLESEYSGIFNWALDGLRAWQDEGSLAEPASVTENVATYIQEANSVARWMADRTTKDPQASVSVRTTYEAFKQWTVETDEVCRTDAWFGRRMGEIGYHSTVRRTADGVKKVYTGFSITGVKQELQPDLINVEQEGLQ